jgi:hypothetical protein
MKLWKLFPWLTIVLASLCFGPSSARAEEEPGLERRGYFIQSPSAARKFYTREGPGYWFNDLRWIGFDEWSFELNAEERGHAFTYAPMVLLLRDPEGKIQPYMGILPYLRMSDGGVDSRWKNPRVMFGLSWSF